MTGTTSPTVVHVPESQRYEMHVDGELAGSLRYRDRDGVRELIHTEVQPRFGGRGLARDLVRGALDDVRAGGMRMRPVCPYVKRFLDPTDEYADIDVRFGRRAA